MPYLVTIIDMVFYLDQVFFLSTKTSRFVFVLVADI